MIFGSWKLSELVIQGDFPIAFVIELKPNALFHCQLSFVIIPQHCH